MADYMKHLVSHWQMSDVNPPDVGWQGYGNDGTGVGLVAATDIVNGIAGGMAIEFNGVDECVEINSVPASFDSSQPWSVFGWTKIGSYPVQQTMFGMGDESSVDRVGIALAGNRTKLTTNGLTGGNGPTVVTLDEFHLLGAVWDGADFLVYLDDGLDYTVTPSGPVPWAALDVARIGAMRRLGVTVEWFDGHIDEVMLFGTAITALQVQDLRAFTRQGRY